MDRNTILAVVLSLAIWMGWQKFYMEPIQKRAAEQSRLQKLESDQASPAGAAQMGVASPGATAIAPAFGSSGKTAELKSLKLETGNSTVTVSSGAGFFQAWELKGYSNAMEKSSAKVDLKSVTGFDSQIQLRTSDPSIALGSNVVWDSLEKKDESSVISTLSNPNFSVQRKVTILPSGFGSDVSFAFHFKAEPPKFVFVDLIGSPNRANDQEGNMFGKAPDKVKITYRNAESRNSVMAVQVKENVENLSGIKWMGLDTRYFVMAIVPGAEIRNSTGIQIANDKAEGQASVRTSLVIPTEGKKDFTFPLKVYFGPKHMESLKAVDTMLADAIDFGWTSFLAVPLLQALKWLYIYVKNYGVAIILLTFSIKMLLFPLTYKSTKSMAKMAKLQPQLNALREKYKDDKEKLNVEMMSFMKNHGYNPVGGCLPIVLQMPIFFALYRVLFNSMELYQTPFVGWIHDLSSPDPLFVTPVILSGLMFLQQKISPNTVADPMQQKMLQFMPIMFGMFMLMLPAGLNIYMVVNSSVSILQQWVLNHRLGIYAAKKNSVLPA